MVNLCERIKKIDRGNFEQDDFKWRDDLYRMDCAENLSKIGYDIDSWTWLIMWRVMVVNLCERIKKIDRGNFEQDDLKWRVVITTRTNVVLREGRCGLSVVSTLNLEEI